MTQPRANWVGRITEFFLNRRSLTLVLFLLLSIGGSLALVNLRREGFPKVPVKIVVVSTIYKGAAPTEVEQSVTGPIESAIKDVKEVKSIASTSGESFSTVIATLNEDANVDSGLQNITSKVASVNLPADADKPSVTQPTTGGSTFVYGLSGNLSFESLMAQGRIFEQELEQVKGVKSVELASGVTDHIVVTFDPALLAAAGVDISGISKAIQASNVNLPAGSNLTIDGSRATVLIAARDSSLSDLEATPLPTLSGGFVALSSVATVRREVDQSGSINRVGATQDDFPVAQNGLVYNVDTRSDTDILLVQRDVAATITRLRDNGVVSPELRVTTLYDDAAATTRQLKELEAGAIGEKWEGIGPIGYIGYVVGGIWLLMLAMFLFVNIRTALIAGAAIPLSFLFTVLALYFAGISLNTLTLFSMILVLGLIVDPAIVVLESIQRYKDLGYTGREGVLAAVSTIGQGLVMATACSIIVFLPFGIVSGVFGEIIKYIPITVIPALIASFFVPLIFLAPLASRFMKAHKHAGAVDDEEKALWAVSRWFKRANLVILRHVWLQIPIMLIAIVAPLAVTGYLFSTGKITTAQFSKPHDTIEALVTVSYPASFTNAQIDEVARATEAALDARSEITSYYYMAQSPTGFTIFISLTPTTERVTTSETVMEELKSKLPQDTVRQVYASANTLSAGPPTSEFPIQIQIYEGDLTKLKDFALKVADHARDTKGVIRVSDGYTDGSTTNVQIQVNKAAVAARGLNPAILGGQVAGLLGEQSLTKLNLGTDTIDVIGVYKGSDGYNSLSSLGQIPIATPTGPIPLSQLASISVENASGSISHQNGLRFATVRAQVDDNTNPFQVQKDLNDWAKSQLSGAGLKSDALESKGEGDDIAKSFINLFQALGVAILLIYLVLALFFGSFLKPLIITFALPLSFLGVFPILAILDNEFGFLEILGLITLAGIVVNVGIFIIDYANNRVAEGVSVKEAIAEATAVRFRPIFLTKITALGSLLPLAIFSPFWRGLSSVIIAGILTSGVLSLFTTPILYTWFSHLSKFPGWVKRKLSASRLSKRRGSLPTAPAQDPSA